LASAFFIAGRDRLVSDFFRLRKFSITRVLAPFGCLVYWIRHSLIICLYDSVAIVHCEGLDAAQVGVISMWRVCEGMGRAERALAR
jgi:hypothetical protein